MINAKVTVVLTLWGLLLITHVQGDNTDRSCRKFYGTPDDCMPIQNCASLYELALSHDIKQNHYDLLRSRQCGSLNGVNYVCCPKPKPPPKIDSSCQTPNDKPGTCKPVQECITLLDLVNKQLRTSEETRYLQRSQCGHVNGIFMVCCAIEPVVQPGVRAITADNTDSSCRKFDGIPDDCMPIQKCGGLYELLMAPNIKPNDVDLLRIRQCNFLNGVNYVCCPKPKPPPKIDSSCQTPNDKRGACKPVQECITLLDLVNKQLRTPEETRYLQRSQCGHDNGIFMVCCAIEPVVQPGVRAITTDNTDSSCRKFDGIPDDCMPIQKCASLYELLMAPNIKPNDVDLLRIRQCNFLNGVNYVCCPKPKPPPKIEGPTTSTRNFKGTEKTTTGINRAIKNEKTCGKSGTTLRISGGKVTTIYEYPWTALILCTDNKKSTFSFCGGSLINRNFVLTAAHCFSKSYIPKGCRQNIVRLGEWNTKTDVDCETDGKGRQLCAPRYREVVVQDIISHPKYNQDNQMHDIALLRLSENVDYTPFISPICLPWEASQQKMPYVDDPMEVTGWGATENSKHSVVKLKTTVRVLDAARCELRTRHGITEISETQICATGGDNDACVGDSGGPLMQLQSSKTSYYLMGVVSYGTTDICGKRGARGIYTRVGAYMDWIQDTIEQ